MIYMKKDFIFHQIRNAGYPCWSLYLLKSYNRVHIRTYNGDATPADSDNAAKCEKSCNILDTVISEFPANTSFSIEIKQTSKSSGSGVIGPLEFDNNTNDTDSISLSGFQSPLDLKGLGYAPESLIDEKIRSLEAKQAAALAEMEFRFKREQLESEIKQREERIRARELELNEAQKKYDSATAKAGDALLFALKKGLSGFMPAESTQLGEVNEADNSNDERANLVNSIADEIYSSKCTESDILNLKKVILNGLARKKENSTSECAAV